MSEVAGRRQAHVNTAESITDQRVCFCDESRVKKRWLVVVVVDLCFCVLLLVQLGSLFSVRTRLVFDPQARGKELLPSARRVCHGRAV